MHIYLHQIKIIQFIVLCLQYVAWPRLAKVIIC